MNETKSLIGVRGIITELACLASLRSSNPSLVRMMFELQWFLRVGSFCFEDGLVTRVIALLIDGILKLNQWMG